jgi:hypothetical protein
MDVGTKANGEAALMVIATGNAVPADLVARVAALDGVQSARAIDLG